MSSFETYILDQAHMHPAFAPQDAIKLCYQATFGAEHLLQEAASVRAYFDKEYAETPAANLPLYESISSEYGRVNLASWKYHKLPAEWLFQIFFLTASTVTNKSADDLYACFDCIHALCQKGLLPFSAGNWLENITKYQDENIGSARPAAVHHSNAYRVSEKPAYRIVHAKYLRLIPLLQAIASLPIHEKEAATIITLDGRAASGKSTLAAQLTAILQAGLIHMDDFFLPPALRSSARLAQPGGNVDYERFAAEVLPHLSNPQSFSYLCFDCSQMAMGDLRTVAASPYRIVEGSYSNHPAFGNYADFKILCDIDPETQMQRIQIRNGAELAEMFRSRWIPMEETYFQTFQIRDHVDWIWESK